jgi:hypothetical protein
MFYILTQPALKSPGPATGDDESFSSQTLKAKSHIKRLTFAGVGEPASGSS